MLCLLIIFFENIYILPLLVTWYFRPDRVISTPCMLMQASVGHNWLNETRSFIKINVVWHYILYLNNYCVCNSIPCCTCLITPAHVLRHRTLFFLNYDIWSFLYVHFVISSLRVKAKGVNHTFMHMFSKNKHFVWINYSAFNLNGFACKL